MKKQYIFFVLFFLLANLTFAQISKSTTIKQNVDLKINKILQKHFYKGIATSPNISEGTLGLKYKPYKVVQNDSTIVTTYSYSVDGRVTTRKAEKFENGQWVTTVFEEYVYNSFNGNLKLEAIVTKTWDYNTNSLQYAYRTFYNYDNNGNMISETYQNFTNGVDPWMNVYKTEWLYNAQNELLKIDQYLWMANNWIHYIRGTYTYTGQVITQALLEVFNPMIGTLENNELYTFTYNENLDILSELKQVWGNGAWVNSDLETHEYNNSFQETLKTDSRWNGSNWEVTFKEFYTYENDNLVMSYNMYLNELTGVLLNGQKETYSYGNTPYVVEYTLLTWDEAINQFINVYRKLYSRTYFGSIITELHQDWIGINWANKTKAEYEYDINGNCTLGKSYIWDNSWVPVSGEPIYNFQVTYNLGEDLDEYLARNVKIYYNNFVGVQDEINGNLSFNLDQNYPNPFNPNTTIKFVIPASGNVTLKIYDMLGKEVATLVNEELAAGSYTRTFNANNLSSGVYFYKLQAGNLTQTKKMMLMK